MSYPLTSGVPARAAAESLECLLWHWKTLLGVAVEERDGETYLIVTLTKIDKRARRQVPSSLCGWEVRLRTLAELLEAEWMIDQPTPPAAR